MDYYKFGNNICRLREKFGLTQGQLAAMLDVSDKAVSKWENGQAIPRMETFEKMAGILETTVEEMLAAARDNTYLVYFKNDFSDVLHLDVDGKLISIKGNESEWVEVTPKGFTVSIQSDFGLDEFGEMLTDTAENLKEKLMGKLTGKAAKHIMSEILTADCTYKCTGYSDGETFTVDFGGVNLGDKTLIFQNFLMMYPKLIGETGTVTLEKVRGQNTKHLIKMLKREGLWADLGDGFLWMLIGYPLRGLYFKHLCKPHVIKKNILNADKLNAKRKNGKPIGCFGGIIIFILSVIFALVVESVGSIIFMDTEKPYLVAADYSTITNGDDVYIRIDELPPYAYPEEFLGATIWEDARTEGLSNLDNWAKEDKVMLYKDKDGGQYLWLVEDYINTITSDDPNDDDGYKDYEDFDEHYVYMLTE